MADKILNTRILLRYDSYTNWTTNNPVLKVGEMAIAYIQTGDTQEVNSVTAPQVLIKVGDGTSAYKALPFVSAKSADVYGWAKAATKPEYQASEIKGLDAFIATEIQDTDTQYKIVKVNDYQYKLMSKNIGDADYTTEVAIIDIPNDTAAIKANADAIDALELLVGEVGVATQIANAIADLDLANTYDAKGAAAAAETNAKAHATNLNTAMDTRVAGLEAKFGEGEGTVEAQIAAAVKVETDARVAAVAGVQGEVDALEQLHATDKAALEGSIATAKQAGDDAKAHSEGVAADLAAEVTARGEADTALGNRITAIEGDYLKAADKTELADDIAENASAISALETKVGDKSVSAQITAVTDPIAADVATIKGDYLKAADKTELSNATTAVGDRVTTLEGQITGLSGAMHFEGVKDALPEDVSGYEAGDVIVVGNKEYVFNDGAFVEFGDVSAQAEAITALTGRMDTAESEIDTLQSEMDAVEQKAIDNAAAIALKASQADHDALAGRVATAEGDITALETEVGKKAAQADHEALAGRVTTAEGKITVLEGEMDTAQADIDALELKVGDASVSAQIKEAIDALKIGDYAKAADLTAAVARVATAEGKITTLEGEMDTAQADISTLKTDVAKKANDADLAAVAKSGNVNDLIQTSGDVLIFDCGNSMGESLVASEGVSF